MRCYFPVVENLLNGAVDPGSKARTGPDTRGPLTAFRLRSEMERGSGPSGHEAPA